MEHKKRVASSERTHEVNRMSVEDMLSSIGEGIIIIDDKLHITTVNTAASRILGKNASLCLGERIDACFSLVDDPSVPGERAIHALEPFFQNAFSADAPRHTSFTESIPRAFVTRDGGEPVPVALSIATLHDAEGRVTGGIIAMRDITAEIENEKIKTEFVSIASHQLSAPLGAIRWNIEMLLNQDIGPITMEQRSALTDILESNNRMIRLVSDLLNVSRLESGRIRLSPEQTHIKKLIEDVVNEYKHYIMSRGCVVSVKMDPHNPDPVINIDPILIRQVINNLIVNAVQYASTASSRIEIAVQKNDVDYQVSVWDNGIGIPEDEQKKIFTKFFRADNAQSKEAIGTGLGLYITKMIVELSGGKMWFVSKQKEGTTFFFTIPITGSAQHHGEVSLT